MSFDNKLNVAIDELNYALKSEDNRANREHYINNAIRIIKEAKALLKESR